jgi:hypothetical protein
LAKQSPFVLRNRVVVRFTRDANSPTATFAADLEFISVLEPGQNRQTARTVKKPSFAGGVLI